MNDKKIFGAISVAFVVVLGLALMNDSKRMLSNTERELSLGTSTQTQQTSATSTKTTTANAPKKSATGTQPKLVKILTPGTGEIWVMGSKHTISWTPEAGFNGSLALYALGASEPTGWIISTTGPHQTSYTWDVTAVALSRYSGLKKDVGPGTYVIRLAFDGNIATVTTPPITIVSK